MSNSYHVNAHRPPLVYDAQAELTKVAKLTVAISTFNRPDALRRCLDALWSGDVLPAQVVIVDQSSNDATRSVIEQAQARDMPIVFIRQKQRGLAVSQNAAFGRASHPIVAVIDDDCIPDRGWLASITKSFASVNGLTAVTGRVLPLNPERHKTYAVSSRTSTVQTDFCRKIVPWVVGSGNNFAIKRDCFTEIGGCDERLGPGSPGEGGADMDLFYRLLRLGARIRYEPESLVYHERKSKEGRMSRRWMYGHGMGACFAFWLRQRDLYSPWILAHWVLLRTRLLVRAFWSRRWLSVHEELLVLTGTLRGFLYGLFAHKPD